MNPNNTAAEFEPAPYAASSLYYAIEHAPLAARAQLKALYALHRKWREASMSSDNHFAVTTLNWWHEQLEHAQHSPSEHPALKALALHAPNSDVFAPLQNLLHGHMHWHHLNRIERIEQLTPTIQAIGNAFAQCYLSLCSAPIEHPCVQRLIHESGQALWWIDHLRHLGHNLTGTRLWLPMLWLKTANLPAHLLLNTQQPANVRAQQFKVLLERIVQQTRLHIEQYQSAHDACTKNLNHSQLNTLKSWRTLMQLRIELFNLICEEPADIFNGLVSIGPVQKWWRALTRRA